MNTKKVIVLVIVLFAIGLGVGGYFLWKNSKDEGEGEGVEDDKAPGGGGGSSGGGSPAPGVKLSANQELLKKNLGAAARVSKDGVVIAYFNSNANFAQFYNNDRVKFFDATKKVIRSGRYTNGGKSIIMDNGVIADSGSVWSNMANAIK